MPHRAFLAFMLPSLVAMILFIALPIASVAVQSLYIQHERSSSRSRTARPSAAAPRKCASTQRRRKSCARKSRWAGSTGLAPTSTATTSPSAKSAPSSADNAGFSDAAQPDLQSAVLQSAVLHAGLHLYGDAAGDAARFLHSAGRQCHPADLQGSGDLFLAAADDRHAAGRRAGPLLDDRHRRASSAPRCSPSSTIRHCR